MRSVRKPHDTIIPDGMYNRADLYMEIAKLAIELRGHPQVHGCWGFIDEHDPMYHAMVIENGQVVATLDRSEYLLMRPQAASIFAQRLEEAKAAQAAKMQPKTVPATVEPQSAEIVAAPQMNGLSAYHARKRAEKAEKAAQTAQQA